MIIEDADFSEINAAIEGAIDEAGIVPTQSEDTQEQDEETNEAAEGDAPEVDGESDGDDEGEPPQYSPDETKAREKGWRPKEEWTGNPDEWIDAGEFNRRQPLYDRLSAQAKEIKRLQKGQEATVKYLSERDKKIRDQAIAEYEAKKREAVKYGDEAAYDAAEAELKRVQEEKGLELDENTGEDEESTPAQPEIPTFITEFAKANPWFETDQDMTAIMVSKTESLVKSGIPLEQAIPQAKEHVKKTFPQKFTNPKKERATTVMSGSRASEAGKGKVSESDLTPDQREAMYSMIKTGHMTKEQFLKDYAALEKR